MQIETAYDILFMQSMKKRLSGEANVSQSVRFADVARRKPAKQVCLSGSFQYSLEIEALPSSCMQGFMA